VTEAHSPDELRARGAVRDLSRPEADAEYRARLRAAFVAGAVESRLAGVATTEAPDPVRFGAGDPATRARVLRGPWTSRPSSRWAMAAAAAAVLLVAIVQLDRPAPWQITDVAGEGIAVVDGRAVPLNHRDELARALRPGARVIVPSGTRIELMSPGNLMVQMLSGTEAVVPQPPSRWFRRTVRGEITTGQWRITTGPAFRGARMMVMTPEAAVELTGTTLAVIREPHGTCVCVLEGAVKVGPRDGARATVEAGYRRFMFADGRDESDEMREDERAALGAMKDERAGMMER
jgi:ferric-dicitrate binding protein FerR (iron transport regulator)